MSTTFKTRDPNSEEVKTYDATMKDIEQARLALQQYEVTLRRKYGLPDALMLDTHGVFLWQGRPLRDKAKPGAPIHMQHKATREELATATTLRGDVEAAQLEQRTKLHELRKTCDAPYFAQLNTEFRWTASDDPRQPPRMLAVALEEKDEKEEDASADANE